MAVDPSQLTRRERRKHEVHTRIIEAAMALFEERGPQETTVAEIAERADVAHKTFFNHFPSKQHLLRAISEQSIDGLLETIEDARKQPGSNAERIHAFFTQVAEDAESAGPMRRELLTELIHTAHQSGNEPQQARRLHDAFAALVRDGVDSGEFRRDHDLETLTEMVQGAFYVLMFSWANLESYPLRARADAAARFLTDAMTDAPAPRRDSTSTS
jgi:AcrR family transcriptional regulator